MIPPKRNSQRGLHNFSILTKQVITIAISRKPANNTGQKTNRNDAHAQAAKQDIPPISTRIRLVDNPKSKVRAEASINIGDTFAVHGLRVIEGQKGLFVSMPQRSYTDSGGETKYSEVFHAVTAEARQAIIQSVSQAYTQAVEMAQSQSEDAAEDMSAPNME